MITLEQDEISVLVGIALAGGQCIPLRSYKTFRSIEAKGLIALVNQDNVYNLYKLTPTGIQTLLAIPDDYQPKSVFYPVAMDIQKAKAIVSQLAE
jgi:hypothetical protein